MAKILSLSSLLIAFIISLVSAYLFQLNKISFETLIWMVIGSLSVLMIIIYQEIWGELYSQNLNQKKLDEKLKIYKRLAKIEEVLKYEAK